MNKVWENNLSMPREKKKELMKKRGVQGISQDSGEGIKMKCIRKFYIEIFNNIFAPFSLL